MYCLSHSNFFCPLAQQDVVKLEVDSISNPTRTNDGSCHFINKTQIEVSLKLLPHLDSIL